MICTIEELKEEYDKNLSNKNFMISYKEWLLCMESLLDRVKNDDKSFHYLTDGFVLLLVDVADLSIKDEKEYNDYYNLLEVFFKTYQKALTIDYDNTSPNEVYLSVLNKTAFFYHTLSKKKSLNNFII